MENQEQLKQKIETARRLVNSLPQMSKEWNDAFELCSFLRSMLDAPKGAYTSVDGDIFA